MRLKPLIIRATSFLTNAFQTHQRWIVGSLFSWSTGIGDTWRPEFSLRGAPGSTFDAVSSGLTWTNLDNVAYEPPFRAIDWLRTEQSPLDQGKEYDKVMQLRLWWSYLVFFCSCDIISCKDMLSLLTSEQYSCLSLNERSTRIITTVACFRCTWINVTRPHNNTIHYKYSSLLCALSNISSEALMPPSG